MQKNKKISVGSFGEKLQTNGRLTYGRRGISYGNHVVALIHNTISENLMGLFQTFISLQ